MRKLKIRTRLEIYSPQILIAALVAGAGLRWFQIGRSSFWYDETFSTLTARLSLSQIISNVALDVHPPGYYVLLYYWLQLGQTEAFIRALSVVFSLAAILAIYGFTAWLFDRATAALSALGMALFPFQVYFGQEARMYSLVIFLTVLLLWFFLAAVTRPGNYWAWIGYVLVATGQLYVQYYVVFILLAFLGWILLNLRYYWASFFRFVGANGLILLLFWPQLAQALNRAEAYLTLEAWQPAPSLLSPLTAIYYLLFGHRSPVWIVPIGLFLTFSALILIAWESRRRDPANRPVEILFWLCLILPIMVVTIISRISDRSIYVERSFAVVSPVLILLLARGATTAPRWSPTPYLVGLLALPVGVTLVTHATTPDPAKPPLREVAQVIETGFQPGDVSLHLQDASAIPALWYTPHIKHVLVDRPGAAFIFDSTHQLFGGDVTPWPAAASGAERLWLTVMPGYTGPEQIAVYETIEANYPRLMVKDWGAIQLYLYDLPGDE